jgi:cell cycle arrest protein BUB3
MFMQPERVYRMDIVGNKLVVGLAGRLVHIYDVRNMDAPIQVRESSLKYMTRAIACMLDGQGYACASIEGRVSVEYFDPSPEVQSKRYAFKCHRRPSPTEKDVDQVWSVNSLAFHPTYGTFASGGSDGTVCFWDHTAKKRLRQTPRYREAVSALAFDPTGTKLAVGIGYMWDEGEEGGKRSRPGVVVRDVGNEVKVRCARLVYTEPGLMSRRRSLILELVHAAVQCIHFVLVHALFSTLVIFGPWLAMSRMVIHSE